MTSTHNLLDSISDLYFLKIRIFTFKENSDMDLRLKKYTLVQRIMGIEDEGVLKAISKMLDQGGRSDESRISIDQYNQDLEDAERGFDENGGVDLEDVRKKILAR
jgi:hypothetical protein